MMLIRALSCFASCLLLLQGAQATQSRGGPIDVFAGASDEKESKTNARGLRYANARRHGGRNNNGGGAGRNNNGGGGGRNNNARGRNRGNGQRMGMNNGSMSRSQPAPPPYKIAKVEITNLSNGQPLGEFFVMNHNEDAAPVFQLGKEATQALGELAETGDAEELVRRYVEVCPYGVREDSLSIESLEDLQGLGDTLEFYVLVSEEYPLISFASMMVNTNDGFVGVSGLEAGEMTIYVSGYDAGTELNNEDCEYVPGPACPETTGNERTPDDGEGKVYIHPGIHGVYPDKERNQTDLNPALYDWRNPAIKVEITMEDYEEVWKN